MFYVLAWTTTPWTLPSNLMLAVNTKIKYRRFKKDGKNYIAADFATDLFKDCDDCGCIDPEKLLNVRYLYLDNIQSIVELYLANKKTVKKNHSLMLMKLGDIPRKTKANLQ